MINKKPHNKRSDEEIRNILINKNEYLRFLERDKENSLKAFFECIIHGPVKKSRHLERYLKYEKTEDKFKTCCLECISEKTTKQLTKADSVIQEESDKVHGFFEFKRRDPNDINKAIFVCKKHLDKGELTPQNIMNHLKGHNPCCPELDTKFIDKKSFQKKTNKKFGEYSFIVKDVLPKSKVLLICAYHKIPFTIEKDRHFRNKYGGCYDCRKEKSDRDYESTITHKDFIKKGRIKYPQYVYPDKEIIDYITKNSLLPVICKKHGAFYINYYRHIENKYGSGYCPECTGSIYEKKIMEYLRSKGVAFEKHFTFNDCRYKQVLHYDFYLKEYNLLLEFDGHQHTSYPNAYHKTKAEFELCQIRDKKKNQYAKMKQFNLLRIPETDKKKFNAIIQNAINEIINNHYVYETAGTGKC